MSPPRNFLDLPYELRHQIYRHYFALDNGYVFNSGSGKLATSNNEPPDLSLMYTCSTIAAETKGLPLSVNTISFSTVYHKDWSSWAIRFHCLHSAQRLRRFDSLVSSLNNITPDIHAQLAAKFPLFITLFIQLLEEEIEPNRSDLAAFFSSTSYRDPAEYMLHWSYYWGRGNREGECLSMVHQATEYALQLLAQARNEKLDELSSQEPSPQGDRLDLVGQCYEPWAIPSWSDLEATGRELQDEHMWQLLKNRPDHFKFRFSATAVAIRFLRHLSDSNRLSIRKIILDEDHMAVGDPECHAQGLIPFCKENPRLQIERRVSLINNILQRASHYEPFDKNELEESARAGYRDFSPGLITEEVTHWLVEALAVMDAGMPAGAFTFVLDGEPAADLCSEVFQGTIHRDLAWHSAVEQCYPLPPGMTVRHEMYFFNNNLVRVMGHLVNQTSILHSNFDAGQFWDVGKVMEMFQDWTLADVSYEYRLRNTHYSDGQCDMPLYEMPPSLPSWVELLLENYDWEIEGA
ncbi:hypothetical protein NM208_g9522 [Fusarium decemcellulare]|uniref:Uncharacterized protein n=1 Tax=Fusarium decemcellulare TaxID=57161 RepID=A0ACC1S1G1_9HYPO|nr:hypothetical protein NM208_g9522 [Fusarium decemcellulare]